MINVVFDAARARHLLNCLTHQRPIECLEGANDYLLLAGICMYLARQAGPSLHDKTRLAQASAKNRSTLEQNLTDDLLAGVQFSDYLVGRVADRTYKQEFDDICKALVGKDRKGLAVAEPLSGYKNDPRCRAAALPA